MNWSPKVGLEIGSDARRAVQTRTGLQDDGLSGHQGVIDLPDGRPTVEAHQGNLHAVTSDVLRGSGS